MCSGGACVAQTYTASNVTEWSSCQCPASVMTRSLTCRNQVGSVVAQSYCASATPISQACSCTTATWYAGAWSACTGTSCAAGAGTQTRTIECRDSNGAATTGCAESSKPAASQACNRPCTYSWTCRAAASTALGSAEVCGESNAFAACGTTCGTSTRTRVVTCRDDLNQAATDSACDGTKPGTSLACTATDTCGWRCYATGGSSTAAVLCDNDGAFGTCSATCGSGQQTRAVGCFGDSLATTLSDSFCTPNAPSKPATTRACTGTGCVEQWYCAATGADVSTRRLCSEVPAWSTCSSTCGAGVQTRQVMCMNQLGQAGTCAGVAAPANSQACSSTAACVWRCKPTGAASSFEPALCTLSTAFAACNENCGAGTRTRTVGCYAPAALTVALDDAMCPTATAGAKPVTSTACEGTDCVYSYSCAATGAAASTATDCVADDQWSACGTTCGESTQTRQVLCKNQKGETAALARCQDFLPAVTTPAASKACVAKSSCLWSAAAWGACSATCGAGTTTRAVTCRSSNQGTQLVHMQFHLKL